MKALLIAPALAGSVARSRIDGGTARPTAFAERDLVSESMEHHLPEPYSLCAKLFRWLLCARNCSVPLVCAKLFRYPCDSFADKFLALPRAQSHLLLSANDYPRSKQNCWRFGMR
jgi:hypothetical protein